jgi:hypothetical protein
MPVRVEPVRVVQEGVKIISLECAKVDIGLEFREDPSLSEAGAKWAMMDSSRFLQVLLNLLTVSTNGNVMDITNYCRMRLNLHETDRLGEFQLP